METQPTISAEPAKQPFNLGDYVQFKRMVTLQIIPVVYGIIAVFITLAALRLMFTESHGYYSSGFLDGGFIPGLVVLIAGNIIWRMWCEFIIVLFRINKSLQDVEMNTRQPKL